MARKVQPRRRVRLIKLAARIMLEAGRADGPLDVDLKARLVEFAEYLLKLVEDGRFNGF